MSTLNSILEVTTKVVFGYAFYFLFLKIETFIEIVGTLLQKDGKPSVC